MTAPIDVVNLALDQIGARARVASPVPLASDGSQAGDVACLHYGIRFDSLARGAPWNCLTQQAKLTLLKAAAGSRENPAGTLPLPPAPWLYSYALPPDCIRARYIPDLVSGPNVAVPFITGAFYNPVLSRRQKVAIPFKIAIDKDQDGNKQKVLLTNYPSATLVYIARVDDPDLWDSQFTTAFVSLLAAFFVNPLNRDANLAQQQIAIAQAQILEARISDGNEGPSSIDHVPDFISARSGAYGYDGDEFFMAPWDSVSFPIGSPL